jgi:single-stranded DNA-binding protein
MLNEPQIIVHGNLTADPELRFFDNGTAFAEFGVAQNPRYRTANGEWADGETVFLRVKVWRDLAEAAAQDLKKGQPCDRGGPASSPELGRQGDRQAAVRRRDRRRRRRREPARPTGPDRQARARTARGAGRVHLNRGPLPPTLVPLVNNRRGASPWPHGGHVGVQKLPRH